MRNYYRLPETIEQIDKILLDNEVEVFYNDPDEVPEDVIPDVWGFSWKHGFMGLGYSRDDEYKAKLNAAVFVNLWLNGLDVADSSKLAAFWVEKHG